MADASITVNANGPYLVKGPVTLLDPSGKKFVVQESFALCRCGGSENKPFCDGTHRKIGFSSEVEAR